MNLVFERYAQQVQRHPKAIIAVWVVALIVALPFAAQIGDVLAYDMTSMGGLDSESSEGQEIVDSCFEGSIGTDTVLVIPYDDQDALVRIQTGLLESGILSDSLYDRFGYDVSYGTMGAFGREGSEKGVLILSLAFGDGVSAMDEIGNVRSAVADAVSEAGLDVRTYVTGSIPIAYDTLESADADIAKIDPLSILIILVLLGLFFWTLVTALVPPIVVGTAYGTVLALVFALGQFLDIFYITKTIVLVSMLGAGVDYSIFIIARYREERNYHSRSKEEALTEAIKWAGESVLTSGLAVIIGFAVMSLCSFSLVSTMAISLALGIVVAMLAALTLIPAILALCGDRIFWPRRIEDYTGHSRMRHGVYGRLVSASRRYFSWAGRFSTKHAWSIVAVAILITAPLGYVALTSEDSFDMISVMPDSEAKEGVDALTSATDGGYLMPTYVLIETDEPVATIGDLGNGVRTLTWTDAGLEYVSALQSELIGSTLTGGSPGALQASDDNISLAMGPTPWVFLYSTVESVVSGQVYQQAYSQAYEAAFQQAIGAGMDEDSAKAVADSAAKEAAESYVAGYVTPEVVNHAIIEQAGLPDMVTAPLAQFFDSYGAWGLAPSDVLSPAVPVTVASLIDYQLNVSTGLVSYDSSDPSAGTDGMYMRIMVIVSDEPMSQRSMDSIASAREVMAQFAEGNGWVAGTWVLGTGAVLYDISDVVNSEFHWIELGVVILIYFLLLFVLGVYFTPIRSLATILMSVVWTLGALHLVFVDMLGVDVIWVVPIVLFVICLGLGMDYDILLTTRIREGKLKGMSNDEAIQNAVSWAGSVITLCGLVMGGTFLTLLTSGSSMLQEVGFALGFAILVDALFVVPYVVPALMHLMGDWSWKGPRFLAGRRDPIARDEES